MKHEIVIMQCLWKYAPLSCTEILAYTKLDIQEKALYKIMSAMQKINIIQIAEMRQGTHKPTKLYAPSITEVDYLERTIRTNPIFHNAMIAPLFQRFMGSIEKQDEIDELHAILDARRKGK